MLRSFVVAALATVLAGCHPGFFIDQRAPRHTTIFIPGEPLAGDATASICLTSPVPVDGPEMVRGDGILIHEYTRTNIINEPDLHVVWMRVKSPDGVTTESLSVDIGNKSNTARELGSAAIGAVVGAAL